MKKLGIALVALLLAALPAAAQWQVPQNTIPNGRGGGTQGFDSIVPGVAGQPLVSNGVGAKAGFGTIANSGFTPGAANTYKGSLNGTTVADIAWPPCTAVNQAIRYAAGVGPNCGSVSVLTGYDMPINSGLSSSAAAGALTISLTQADGTTPTSSAPVLIPFRSTTGTNGGVVWGAVASPLTIVVPSGATLGTSNNVPFRVWVFAGYNAGAPQLGVATCSSATAVYGCSAWEASLKTGIAITSGATSAGVLYTTAGASLDAVRIVGYCDYSSGLATAGTWTGACTSLQPMGPGIKKPGDVVQTVRTLVTGAGTGTNTYTFSNTPPTTANGNLIASVAITPVSPANRVVVDGAANLQNAAGNDNVALFIASSASSTSVATSGFYITTGQSTQPFYMSVGYEGLAGTITSYSMLAASSSVMRWNAINNGAMFGATGATWVRVQEIQG